MARSASKKLTNSNLKTWQAKANPRQEIGCNSCTGFAVRKTNAGLVAIFRYRLPADTQKGYIERVIKIGRLKINVDDLGGGISLEKARHKANEHRETFSKGKDPKAEAEKAHRDTATELMRQKNAIGIDFLNGGFSEWLKIHAANSGKHTKGFVTKHFPTLLKRPMETITPADINAWLATKKKDGLSHHTIKRVYAALRKMLAVAVEQNVIPAHPLAGYKLQVITASERQAIEDDEKAKAREKRKPITQAEIKALFAALDPFADQHGEEGYPEDSEARHWFIVFFVLAFNYGMRPGDLLNLRWSNITWHKDSAQLRKTPNKTATRGSNPAELNLTITGRSLAVLKAYHAQQGKPTTGDVLKSAKTGKPLANNSKGYLRHWRTLCLLAGINHKIDLYAATRHTFISNLVNSGLPLMTVAKLAGQKDEQMIREFYYSEPEDASRDAAGIMERLISG